MKKVILFELHHLGDAVLAVPFVRSAGNCEVHVVCRAGTAQVFHPLLPAHQIHLWEPWWEVAGEQKIHSLRQLPDLLKNLRKLGAAAAFCVWADSRVHWLMRQLRVPRTFGFPVNEQNFYAHELPWRRRRMKLGQLVGWIFPLSHPVQRLDYQQAHLEDWRQLTEAAGWAWNASTPWFEAVASSKIAELRQAGKPIWLIHPGGRLPTKRWPLERFQELLKTFFADLPVILVEPPDSPALVSNQAHHFPIVPTDFKELLSLVQSADLVLCNDSLVAHIAAALGKPVWAIFGSGNPNWFAPYKNESRVIASDVCAFRPCIDRCVQPSIICLESVSVEKVATFLKKTNSL